MNEIATARKMLRDIDNSDIEIEIPQLIVLISESAAAGDLVAAKDFIDRAVSKTDTTPYLRSEAQHIKEDIIICKENFPRGKNPLRPLFPVLVRCREANHEPLTF
jgi:hypothetical protein